MKEVWSVAEYGSECHLSFFFDGETIRRATKQGAVGAIMFFVRDNMLYEVDRCGLPGRVAFLIFGNEVWSATKTGFKDRIVYFLHGDEVTRTSIYGKEGPLAYVVRPHWEERPAPDAFGPQMARGEERFGGMASAANAVDERHEGRRVEQNPSIQLDVHAERHVRRDSGYTSEQGFEQRSDCVARQSFRQGVRHETESYGLHADTREDRYREYRDDRYREGHRRDDGHAEPHLEQRTESRPERRAEVRFESRAEVRPEQRAEARLESRKERRVEQYQGSRIDRRLEQRFDSYGDPYSDRLVQRAHTSSPKRPAKFS